MRALLLFGGLASHASPLEVSSRHRAASTPGGRTVLSHLCQALSYLCQLYLTFAKPYLAFARVYLLPSPILPLRAYTFCQALAYREGSPLQECLADGRPKEAEQSLARCIKRSIDGETRCDPLAAPALTALARAIGTPGEPDDVSGHGEGSEDDGDAGGGGQAKRRRVEDSLSSALAMTTRMYDSGAKQGVLHAFAAHCDASGDDKQACEFRQMLDAHATQMGTILSTFRASDDYAQLHL